MLLSLFLLLLLGIVLEIKFDRSNQILMTPLDDEVSTAGGLFSTDDIISFGVGGTKDSPKQAKFFLRNSARKPLRVMILPWETNDTFLNIGSVNIENTKKFYFGLINDNPIDVFKNTIEVNISYAVIGVIAVNHRNITYAMKAISSENKINRSGVEITFTPDFTLPEVSRILTVLMPDSSVNYTLIATFPPYLLPVYSNAIKQPAWKALIYYSAISVKLFLLICVLGAAFYESYRILKNAVISLSRDNNNQPVLDLRAIGSESFRSPEQKVMHNEVQGKIAWTPGAFFTEEQSNKENQKPLPESVLTGVNNINVQTIINGINKKKKSECFVSKRLPDIPEHNNEKSNSETSSNRSNSSQISSKPTKTSICITTEPYIPLSIIKTRDSAFQKADLSNSKYEQPKFIEFQRRRTRKRNQNNQNSNNLSISSNKKKASVKSNVDGRISSRATPESYCSDDWEKEHVESAFFQSVRHHLQSKVSKGRQIKVPRSSHHLKRKKSLDRFINVAASVNRNGDEEDSVEKATIVRNNRRSNDNGKQIKKQAANSYGKMRFEQSQLREKTLNVERSKKNSLRKTKTIKTRNDRQEKRITTTIRAPAPIIISHEGIAPAIASTRVWTVSFSDVVAGTTSVNSHYNKNYVSQNQKQHPSPYKNADSSNKKTEQTSVKSNVDGSIPSRTTSGSACSNDGEKVHNMEYAPVRSLSYIWDKHSYHRTTSFGISFRKWNSD